MVFEIDCDKMNFCKVTNVIVLLLVCFQQFGYCKREEDHTERTEISATWDVYPNYRSWSLETRIPMVNPDFDNSMEDEGRGKRKKIKKIKKKLEQFLLPLLLAYKLKFFTLIPVFIGGLLLLTGATGLAGFFFALFAAVMGLKHHGH